MTVGIYSITHITSGKRYIGKSINIERRFIAHRYWLNRGNSKKHCNRYLSSAVTKYGIDAFSFEILEEVYLDEKLLAERELFWMDRYLTYVPSNGYNLRRDTASKMLVHQETRNLQSSNNKGRNNPNFGNHWSNEMKCKMSLLKKDQHSNNEIYDDNWRRKIGESSSQFWRKNPEIKQQMAEKVKLKKRRYKFKQLTKDGRFIREWDSVEEIIKNNPGWKWQQIYSVCSGHKKSIYGYKWEKANREN